MIRILNFLYCYSSVLTHSFVIVALHPHFKKGEAPFLDIRINNSNYWKSVTKSR